MRSPPTLPPPKNLELAPSLFSWAWAGTWVQWTASSGIWLEPVWLVSGWWGGVGLVFCGVLM